MKKLYLKYIKKNNQISWYKEKNNINELKKHLNNTSQKICYYQ